MIKDIIDVLAEYTQPQTLEKPATDADDTQLKQYWTSKWQGLIEAVNKERLVPLLDKSAKFKFVFDSIGRHVSLKEQLWVIEMFKKFPFNDKDVDLENP